MADEQHAQACAHAEKNEPIFLLGMVRVIKEERVVVEEH